MACSNCETHWFWKKIGRCYQCMVQLTILCLLFWPAWWLWARWHPRDVGAIALLFFGVACHGLLALHLVMKFLIIPRQSTLPHKKEKP